MMERGQTMKSINMEWMKFLLKDPQDEVHENVIFCTHDIESKGHTLYYGLVNKINDFLADTMNYGVKYSLTDALERCITKEVCEYVSYEALYRLLFKDDGPDISEKDNYLLVKRLYKKHLGITDDETLDMAEKYKLSYSLSYSPCSNNVWLGLSCFWSRNITIEDKASFKARKRKEAIREQKRKAREEKQKLKEESQRQTKAGM